ncbi:lipopolysaccharide biosynthesis protein [Spirosoma sp. BT702]|uniref:Lipopolysaccharide biosynthesis protein n=1 Tax=Spirosoma profusum TaxID=2771354 RepID=A0A927AUT1_9BACT|nr:Wzz/FepE/Etk N-terminal domain-containing protein [Spirosoma profusum]MBD2704803.1 lipopolysaccharide biosynthesis protein [Spirosoma profusum]
MPPPNPIPPKLWLDLSVENIFQTAWQGRVRLVKITAFFGVLGVIVALLTQPEFTSEARIMPEMNGGSTDMVKRLASVAGFAGLDLSDADDVDAVRPDLYPNVLQSSPFGLYLLNQSVTVQENQSTTVANLLAYHTNWQFLNWFRSETSSNSRFPTQVSGKPVRLTKQQQDLLDDVGQRISAKLDTRSGIITITAQMPDANVAANVAQLAMAYLTNYVTSYRTEKARQDLQFYTQRLQEARRRFQTAQYVAFQYNDQHKYYVVQAATMEKQRIESELAIAQTVYTELSRQFEQAKLKVQERTPVFKVLEPAKVPLKRTSPKRTVLVLVYTGTGLLVGLASLMMQQAAFLPRLRATLQSSST